MPKAGKSTPPVNVLIRDGKRYCKKCKNWFDIESHFKQVHYKNSHPKFGNTQFMCKLKDMRNNPDYNPVRGGSQIPYKKGTKEYNKVINLMSCYGMTEQDYDNLFENQKGCCAICKKPQEKLSKSLFVDHCHETGKVRGLLCHHCNSGIGYLQDNITLLESAIQYLQTSQNNEN